MLSPTHHKSGSGSKSQTPNNDASIIRGTNHNVPLTEFISKKRELFLVQMSLENKEEEIDRLEKDVKQKHEKLTTIEMTLESDALRFDKFLKENDRIAHEAMKKYIFSNRNFLLTLIL
jgi:hypothetical protein